MDVSADRFLDLVRQLEGYTHAVTPEQAHAEFDQTSLRTVLDAVAAVVQELGRVAVAAASKGDRRAVLAARGLQLDEISESGSRAPAGPAPCVT